MLMPKQNGSPWIGTGLDFLWLELTNQCNLRCVHCYAESGPRGNEDDVLTTHDYVRLLDEAHGLGCGSVQFIGGEPTLNRDLDLLIRYAREKGFDLIEVFTNLTRLTDDLVALFKSYRVEVATSVYAHVAGVHDKVTTIAGSFARTVANLRRLVAAGIPVRASVIAMDENRDIVPETMAFLRNMGVPVVGSDGIRRIGRGSHSAGSQMSELCGQCAGARLCVGPDGRASPCIMSKAWSVGSVMQSRLAEIVCSSELQEVREAIYREAVMGRQGTSVCQPQVCGPYNSCGPNLGPGPCAPSGCSICRPG
ncbi:MAG: radical SAM protein [Rhizobiales bacterium]|jgi:sulfatase maturation enzyme AslB (radical SAM superfamily)|nr:radical SAM protein [Hyphomicrobiales bacterium]